jgi:hypothetical protein
MAYSFADVYDTKNVNDRSHFGRVKTLSNRNLT